MTKKIFDIFPPETPQNIGPEFQAQNYQVKNIRGGSGF